MRLIPAPVALTAVTASLLGACSTNTDTPSGAGGDTSLAGTTSGGTGGDATVLACGGSDSAAGGTGGAVAVGGDGGANAGEGGTNADGPLPPSPSAGCNKAAPETPGQFAEHSLMSGGDNRTFYTYLPPGYDSSRAYPTIFAFHPCGGSGNPNSNVPIQNESQSDAIIISPQSAQVCYENQIRNSPEIEFFDDTFAYATENYCVDENRVFAIGHSAGSWMAIILGCERGNVIRAHAQVSGGLPMFVKPSDCTGSSAALYLHDNTDVDNNIIGGYAARDRSLRFNGCDDTAQAWDPAPCQEYQGCRPGYPVVFCETTGQGHGRQDNLAPQTFWKFFSQF